MKQLNLIKLSVLLCSILNLSTAYANQNYARLWENYRQRPDTLSTKKQFPYQACFEQAAKRYDIPLTLLLAVARVESNFNSVAKSSKNAIGVMQILWPGTAKHLGIYSRTELKKPCVNIKAGSRYLREMLDRYDNNIHKALAAYNYGPGNIKTDANFILTQGAAGYSAKVYRHLPRFHKQAGVFRKKQQRSLQQWSLLVFNDVHLAKACVNYVHQQDDSLQLEWFDRGYNRFEVVASSSLQGKRRVVEKLEKLGFPPPK